MKSPSRKFTIGRDEKCDVPIADDSVSRVHAELMFLDGGKLSITDCKSSNGTVLLRQGKSSRIEHETILPTDRLRFGAAELSVTDLMEALRGKYPDMAEQMPLQDNPAQGAESLIRCDCGSVRARGERCKLCGSL
jgi:pSer/pThr/pTyr-binding forkhead associated (FHA) protein